LFLIFFLFSTVPFLSLTLFFFDNITTRWQQHQGPPPSSPVVESSKLLYLFQCQHMIQCGWGGGVDALPSHPHHPRCHHPHHHHLKECKA
jgi:hypothetical protein